MPNLRIVYNNAADRATVVASTTAGSLVAGNLQSNLKSEIWRSTATTATLTLTWATTETVACVALPFCNLTSSATIRVQCYTNTGDVTAVRDTGAVQACPASASYGNDYGVTGSANSFIRGGVNTFAFGGGAYADVWFTATPVKKIVITLTDASNPDGYIEAAKLVVGTYWTPERNVEYDSPKVSFQDDSKHERTDAGDLMTDRGVMYRKLSFDLSVMSNADRDAVWRILRSNGMYKPLFVSISPDSTDVVDEQIYMIYGKLSSMSAMQYKFLGMYATSFQIEEI